MSRFSRFGKIILKVSMIALIFSILLLKNNLKAQNVAITDDESYSAESSAMLDVKSTSKGMLVPRLTTVQRGDIINPAQGLMVYDTNLNSFMYYNGSAWIAIPQLASSAGSGDALFAVVNQLGDTVFAVYHDGVRIFVDPAAKGSVGGFAVSGRTPTKLGEKVEYFRVTPDSTRIYVNDSIGAKGRVGGFAVSGRTPTKGGIKEYFTINKDSTRIYVDSSATKGSVGGFAVSGRTPTKGQITKFMDMTRENYFIGHESGKNNLSGLYNAFMGYQTGQANTTGSLNAFFGFQAGYKNSSGSDNLFLGYQSGFSNTTGERNLFLGRESGKSNIDGIYNQFFGYQSGYLNTSGGHNNFIGYQAGYHNTSGWTNIFIGGFSGYNNISGTQNVFLGSSTGAHNTTGFNNVYIGHRCGLNNDTGARNIFIGFESGLNETGSDKLYIDNSDTSTPLIYGDFDANYITINGLFYTTNNAAIHNTWISDQAIEINGAGTGNRTSLIDWHSDDTYTDYCFRIIRYNTGPNAPSYIVHRGTGEFNIQAQDAGYVTISTSATERMRITSAGNVGIGTTSPDKKLHVVGDARVTGSIYYGTSTSVYSKPDYVFNTDYNKYLDPISVEKFVKENGHLPWLTASKDETDGINLTRMQFETVETVENLQLQIINQQKEIENLKSELHAIRAEIKGK